MSCIATTIAEYQWSLQFYQVVME